MVTFKKYLIENKVFKFSGGKVKSTTDATAKKHNIEIPQEQVLRIAENSGIDSIWCRFDYSEGNNKVGKDTIIFNMGSAIDCPSAAAGLCYAENSEHRFKNTIKSRRRQEMQWKNMSSEQLGMALEAIIVGKRKNNIKYVRFNESGDFWGQEDVEKLAEIAALLALTVVEVESHFKLL